MTPDHQRVTGPDDAGGHFGPGDGGAQSGAGGAAPHSAPDDAGVHPGAGDAGPQPGPDWFPDWLAYRAAASPDQVALVAGGARWTYAELEADATALALQLAASGARPGDRIGTLLANGPGAVAIVHAVLRLGATLVPINVRLGDVEIAWQVRDAGITLLVAGAELVAAATGAEPGVALVTLELPAPGDVRLRASDPGDPRRAGVPESDIALRTGHRPAHVLAIIYTSGTTGRPRGAQLTVANFWWSAIGSALNLGAQSTDRWLAILPLFHVGGLSIIVRAVIHGMTVIVHEGFDADRANRAIDEEGVTLVSAVSVMLQRMLDARGDRPYPRSLRCILLGGGPAPLPLLERCAATGVPVVQTYGLTEACSQVATLSPADALRRPGAAGRVLYPNALRIATATGDDAAAGEAGEILVRGPIVMAGYAGQPDATARAMDDGWLRTGDIGSLDADGFLHVHDRRDDLIITGGENVYPAEVEAALLAHPWVDEAGVVGMPDDQWGQRVVAFVRLRGEGLASASDAPAQLRAHCRTLLGGFKVPAEVRIAGDPLPRTASGKLRRAALRG